MLDYVFLEFVIIHVQIVQNNATNGIFKFAVYIGEPSEYTSEIYLAVSKEDNAEWHDINYKTYPIKGYICEIAV